MFKMEYRLGMNKVEVEDKNEDNRHLTLYYGGNIPRLIFNVKGDLKVWTLN